MADADTRGLNAQLVARSQEGQLAAADPKASVWVSANAGTGKTHTLTSRVARLLLAGTAPERILCLTFTRAAAAQMETKLFVRLGKWSTMDEEKLTRELFQLEGRHLDADEIARARRLFARALETPGGLKIQTIHAFCESLLGRFPLEAEVSPHFELADERTAAEMLTEARDRVLSRAADEPASELGVALGLIVRQASEMAFEALLGEVAGSRRKLLRLVEESQGLDGLDKRVALAVGVAPGETPDAIIARAVSEADQAAISQAIAALSGGKTSDGTAAQNLSALVASRDAAGWDTYRQAFLTANLEPRARLYTKDIGSNHPDVAAWMEAERERVVAVEVSRRAAATAQATAAVMRFAVHILQEYEAEKARRALLDYDDLIDKAAALLTTREATQWVLYKLDGGLDHILVDEAQDTSPEQWRVVEALADEFFSGEGAREMETGERTMFAVGDEKQSIFSFQGAEPGTFDAMNRYFRSAAKGGGRLWRDVDLTVSWRTVPAILDCVDKVFADAAVKRGVVADAARTIHHEAVRVGQAGRVEIWPMIEPEETDEQDFWDAPLDAIDTASPVAKLAARITGEISRWIESGEILPQRDRPVRPSDILILVRRRGPFVDELIRQLKNAHVPVAGVDRMVLTEQIAVKDLIALAQFVLLPEDDLTLATVLRSPLVGITEDELFALAHGRKGTLWASLREAANDDARFAEAAALLGDLMNQADFMPPHDFFARLLGPLGGRAKLVARLGVDAHDPIDEFLNLALMHEGSETPSLQSFIRWVCAGGGEIKRDMEQQRDEVRIMTVHGAKGLEANIVIMPDTVRHRSAQNEDKLVRHEDGLVTWNAGSGLVADATQEARDFRKERDDDEYRRLLYVAMTRAKDRLYIAGYKGTRAIPETSWYEIVSNALSPMAEEVDVTFADGPAKVLRIKADQKAEAHDEEGKAAGVRTDAALPAWIDTPATPERVTLGPVAPSHLTESAGAGEPAALSPLAGGEAARYARGRLVHKLLQYLPDIAPAEREAAALDYLKRAGNGFDAGAQAGIAGEVLRVIGDPVFAPLFAPGSRAEVPLGGRIDWRGKTITVTGQVDRLARDGGMVLIADYKTNRPPPASLDKVAAAYLDQMAAYRALAQAAYPDAQVRCALVWTDGATLMELPENLLESRISADFTGA